MPKTATASHSKIRNGHAYYKHTGRYNEVTTKAVGKFENDASPASKQTLVVKGNNSAAAATLRAAWKALGL